MQGQRLLEAVRSEIDSQNSRQFAGTNLVDDGGMETKKAHRIIERLDEIDRWEGGRKSCF